MLQQTKATPNMSDDTETERNINNGVENQPIQIERQLRPSNSAIDAGIANDYRDLTDLMTKLDVEIGQFTGHMIQINDNVSNFVGLAKLWNEQAKTIDQEIEEFQRDVDPNKATTSEKKK